MKENKKQDIELTAQNDYQNEEDDPIVSYINKKKICIQKRLHVVKKCS